MTEELLQAKDDCKELRINLNQKFFTHHLIFQWEYSFTLDQEQFLVYDQIIIQKWFDIYQFIKTEYDILNKNVYNIDTNCYMISIARITKVMCSKYQKWRFIKQGEKSELSIFNGSNWYIESTIIIVCYFKKQKIEI